jgi:hypothetical protein
MKWNVSGEVTISCYCAVEANTVEEARDRAMELGMAGLPFNACQCDPDEAWKVDELDGTPTITLIEQESA